MKTFVVLAVNIVLVSILFCPMVMAAAPSMPDDLQIVQPDPSLPKELSAFFGKWEYTFDNVIYSGKHKQYISHSGQLFVIVEKIDEEKASLYIWRSGDWPEGTPLGWVRREFKVIKDGGKYKLDFGSTEYTLKEKFLVVSFPSGSWELKRVP